MPPDEPNHFYRAFELSCGKLVSEHIGENGVGGNYLPSALLNFADPKAMIDWNDISELTFGNTAVYAPISYLPQAIGIGTARCVTNNVSAIFYAGRFANALASVLLCIWALKKIPFGRKILFIIMVFPVTLQETISLAPDSCTIAISLAFTAYILNLAYKKNEVTKKDIALVTIMGVWIALLKIVYVVLVFLVFLIPDRKIGEKKKCICFKVGLTFIAVIANLIWLKIGAGYFAEVPAGVNVGEQVKFVLTHPLHYIVILLRTVFLLCGSWISCMIGSHMGAFCIDISPIVWVGFLVLFFYITIKCQEVSMKVRKCDIIILLFVFLSGALLVCTSEYVQWTAYASAIIDGVQGRYFTPIIIFPMLAFVLANSKKERKNKNGNGYVSYGKYFYILVLALNGIGILDILHYYL